MQQCSQLVHRYTLKSCGGVGGASLQSATTILEDFRRPSNCAGDAICTVFDMLGGMREVEVG
jgi:hypothetical protein